MSVETLIKIWSSDKYRDAKDLSPVSIIDDFIERQKRDANWHDYFMGFARHAATDVK